MKYLKLFETYKSQKEIETLASLCIRKLAYETYSWNKDFIWTEPREGDYYAMEGKRYRVKFKESDGFTQNAIYVIDDINSMFVRFKGYDNKFKLDEVELTWAEENNYHFKQFIGTSVESATIDKMDRFEELSDFIKNTTITYKAIASKQDGIKGQLEHSRNYNNHMKIIIFYPERTLTELGKSRKNNLQKGMEYDDDDIYFEIFKEFYSTTIHELQHAYDNYRSKGKALREPEDYIKGFQKKRSLQDKVELDEEEKEFLTKLHKQYLNFSHEIDARFTQAVQDMPFSKLEKNDEGHYKFVMNTLADTIKTFQLYFKGWDNLVDKDKKRLIRKVSQFWHFEKERIEERNTKKKEVVNESAMLMAYHVTSKNNLESIMKNGLEPRVPEDYGENGDEKAVYLFKTIEDAKTALEQWLGWRIDDWEEETGEQYDEVLLHVNITGLNCEDTVEFEWTCYDHISPDRIMQIDYEI